MPWVAPVATDAIAGVPRLPEAHQRFGTPATHSAGDNAAMESFYSLLQKSVLDRRRWRTRSALAYAIVVWIEHAYNRRRRQRGLSNLTPVESNSSLPSLQDPTRKQPDHSQPVSRGGAADPQLIEATGQRAHLTSPPQRPQPRLSMGVQCLLM